MNCEIVVIGSMNMDYLVYADDFPKESETIIGNAFSQRFGGKGANQAVAASRLGAKTSMIAMRGNDSVGEQFIINLKNNFINTDAVEIANCSSGVAVCTIARDTNHIIVVPGANWMMNKRIIDDNYDLISNAKIIILQNEVPMEVNKYIVELFGSKENIIIYNPAPAVNDRDDLFWLNDVDFIILNEVEIKELFLEESSMNEDILKKYPNKMILTNGSKGVYYFNGKIIKHIPAFKVEAIDTTGAGDTFIGAFASEYLRTNNIDESISFGNLVASIQVTRVGAQNSIPFLDEVKEVK